MEQPSVPTPYQYDSEELINSSLLTQPGKTANSVRGSSDGNVLSSSAQLYSSSPGGSPVYVKVVDSQSSEEVEESKRTSYRLRVWRSATLRWLSQVLCRGIPVTLGVVLSVIVLLWLTAQLLLFWLTRPVSPSDLFARQFLDKRHFALNNTKEPGSFNDVQTTTSVTGMNTLWIKRLDGNNAVGVRGKTPDTPLRWNDVTFRDPPDYVNASNPVNVSSLKYARDELFQLTWHYLLEEKDHPYVGSEQFLSELFPPELPLLSRDASWVAPNVKEEQLRYPAHYYNSLAVFPQQDPQHFHGRLGLVPQSRHLPLYRPASRVPFSANGLEELSATGDAFGKADDPVIAMSNRLGLERILEDHRGSVCRKQEFPIKTLDDASVVIAFYNEPLSVLLRTIHSVLNRTPPPLLREVILVNDRSTLPDLEPGGFLDSYIRSLPKVKMMRTAQHRGIGASRRHGMHLSTAPVVVFLDSNVEVNTQWLEPLLSTLQEKSPTVVFPQVFAINATDFGLDPYTGSGCRHRIKWNMEDHSDPPVDDGLTTPVRSSAFPSTVYAIRRETLRSLGDFDHSLDFMWNENVELSLRAWQCGVSVHCVPCSVVYHMYQTRSPYVIPTHVVERNRMRTGQLWTDEFARLVDTFSSSPNVSAKDVAPTYESLTKAREFRKRLKCKGFQWYLENVATTMVPRSISDVLTLGPVRSAVLSSLCLDTLQHGTHQPVGLFPCHPGSASQQFLTLRGPNSMIYVLEDSELCVSKHLTLEQCKDVESEGSWEVVVSDGIIRWHQKADGNEHKAARNNRLPRCIVLEHKMRHSKDLVPYRVTLGNCPTPGSTPLWLLTPFVL